MKKPTISLFIPTFNRADLLDQTLQSVALQTLKPYEVLIIDNASTDETDVIVAKYKRFGFKYIKHSKNIGMIENWNSGIKHSTGEYFAMLHSDDLIAPNWHETWIKTISKHSAAFYTSAIAVIDQYNKPLYTCHIDNKSTYIKKNQVMEYMGSHGAPIIAPTGASVYSKKVFDKIGTFNASFKTEADVYFCMNLFTQFDAYYLNKIVFGYRTHPEQTFEVKREKKSYATKLVKLENYFSIIRNFYDTTYKGSKHYRSFYTNHALITLATINLYVAKLEFAYVFGAQKIAKKYFPDLYTNYLDWQKTIRFQLIFLARALVGRFIPEADKKQLEWLTRIK